MPIKLPISRLDDHCRGRSPNFRAAVLATAERDGDNLIFTAEQWNALSLKYAARAGQMRHKCKQPRGLGDLVAAVATPIARALHLDCIDPATQQLRPDSGCAKRRAALNRIGRT